MFHMVNPSGNVYQNVITEQKRDERLAAGWKLVEEETTAEELEQADEPQQVDDPLQMHTTEDDTQDAATEEGAQAAAAPTEPEQKLKGKSSGKGKSKTAADEVVEE